MKILIEKGAHFDDSLFDNDCHGGNLLHHAVCEDFFEVVEFLVQNGADMNPRNDDDATPLHRAARLQNFKMVKYLQCFGKSKKCCS